VAIVPVAAHAVGAPGPPKACRAPSSAPTRRRAAVRRSSEGEKAMGETVQLTASDGHQFDAYRTEPSGKPRGSIVLIQEIFGVNAHIREITDRWAKEGFVVVAPALFDRVEKNFEVGYDEAGVNAGRGIMGKLDIEKALLDIKATAESIKDTGHTAIVGYCFGGRMSWLSALDLDFDAAVVYYGGGIVNALSKKAKCPVMMHFGELDKGIPQDQVDQIRTAVPEAQIFVYNGADHGFACDHRGSYNENATKQANGRTLAFLAQHVG
jgi:carboxymethylenebutenolidase